MSKSLSDYESDKKFESRYGLVTKDYYNFGTSNVNE